MARILLIEPDALLSDSYRMAFAAVGHAVRVCPFAQLAICAADEARPDIVILELHLVQHDGIEFLYEFRSYDDWQDIPIVILSHAPASEFAADQELLRTQLGVRSYLYKPQTSLRTLLQKVHSLTI